MRRQPQSTGNAGFLPLANYKEPSALIIHSWCSCSWPASSSHFQPVSPDTRQLPPGQQRHCSWGKGTELGRSQGRGDPGWSELLVVWAGSAWEGPCGRVQLTQGLLSHSGQLVQHAGTALPRWTSCCCNIPPAHCAVTLRTGRDAGRREAAVQASPRWRHKRWRQAPPWPLLREPSNFQLKCWKTGGWLTLHLSWPGSQGLGRAEAWIVVQWKTLRHHQLSCEMHLSGWSDSGCRGLLFSLSLNYFTTLWTVENLESRTWMSSKCNNRLPYRYCQLHTNL